MDTNETKMNPTIKSGYTYRARPSRGYHDLYTTVTFAPSEGTPEQREKFLQDHRAPLVKQNMWCGGWTPVDETGNVFTITYGYDSGD